MTGIKDAIEGMRAAARGFRRGAAMTRELGRRYAAIAPMVDRQYAEQVAALGDACKALGWTEEQAKRYLHENTMDAKALRDAALRGDELVVPEDA